MADAGTIEVRIGGNITDLEKNLKKGQASINDFGVKTTAATAKVNTAFKGVTTGSNQAGVALSNLSRVAQDAPFGFIGIANNLNPLLESFQRLRAETGKNSLALKALGTSLMGAGGLGLALSAFQFVALGGVDVLKKFFESASKVEKLEAAKKALTEYKEAIQGIFDASAKEATGVIALIAVLKSETETRERKLAALEQLKKINPEIFNGLKLEEGAVKGVDAAYKAYIENLKVVIAAKIKQQQIEAKITQLLQLQGTTLTGYAKGFNNLIKQSSVEEKKRLQSLGGAGAAAAQVMQTIETNGVSAIQRIDKEIEILTKELTELSKGIKIDPLKAAKSAKEAVDKMRGEFKKIRFSPTEVEFVDPGEFARLVEKAFAKIQGQTSVFYQPKVKVEVPINTDNLNDLDRLATIARLKAAGVTKGIQDGLNIGVEGLRFPQLMALAADTEAKLKAMGELIKSTVMESFSGIGEAIGSSIANGGNFIQSAFGGILKTLGQFLVELGKGAIATSKLFLAIQASKTNPFTGIAGGILAIAIGTLLKSVKLPAFADGVNNFSGGLALVGERGPELVNLPRGSDVIPNHALGGITNGGRQEHIIYGSISGDSIYLSNQRAAQRRGRQG